MCTHNQCLRAKKKKKKFFHLKIKIFTAVKCCSILHGRVCVMEEPVHVYPCKPQCSLYTSVV